MEASKNLVVKFGTKVLLGTKWKGEKHLDQRIFNNIANQVFRLQINDINATIVTSGAIEAGREIMNKIEHNLARLGNALSRKKELAGIGTRHLFNKWGKAFEKCNREIAQLLVTYSNLSDEGELQSISSSISTYHELNVIPIINENDVVSDSEIKSMERGLSENDSLTRMIAKLIKADSVLFVTNVGGVFDRDPSINSDAKQYSEIDVKTSIEIINSSVMSGETIAETGRGGISAKLQEALACFDAGMRVSIAGLKNDTIYKFAMGEPVGTMISKSVNFVTAS